MNIRKNESGAVTEILLVILLLVVIVGGTWLVYKKHNGQMTTTTSNVGSTPSEQPPVKNLLDRNGQTP